MIYENSLPDGMVEPDETSVRIEALETLIRHLLTGVPDDALKANAEYLASRRVGVPTSYVAEEDILSRRGAEVASGILRDIWLSRQQHAERQMMIDGTHPLSGADTDA